jgi:hypothetical protein
MLETVASQRQRLFLTYTYTQAEQECRVVHLGRRVGGKTRVGVTFIAPSPEFWRPLSFLFRALAGRSPHRRQSPGKNYQESSRNRASGIE